MRGRVFRKAVSLVLSGLSCGLAFGLSASARAAYPTAGLQALARMPEPELNALYERSEVAQTVDGNWRLPRGRGIGAPIVFPGSALNGRARYLQSLPTFFWSGKIVDPRRGSLINELFSPRAGIRDFRGQVWVGPTRDTLAWRDRSATPETIPGLPLFVTGAYPARLDARPSILVDYSRTVIQTPALAAALDNPIFNSLMRKTLAGDPDPGRPTLQKLFRTVIDEIRPVLQDRHAELYLGRAYVRRQGKRRLLLYFALQFDPATQ